MGLETQNGKPIVRMTIIEALSAAVAVATLVGMLSFWTLIPHRVHANEVDIKETQKDYKALSTLVYAKSTDIEVIRTQSDAIAKSIGRIDAKLDTISRNNP